jgi:hypothetical protein
MNCNAPRLFRHRTTLQFWISGCMRWQCQSCIRKVARRWRAVLSWAGKHGPPPEYSSPYRAIPEAHTSEGSW